MGLEKIGVQAVVDGIGNYLSDMDKLNKATGSAADATEKAATKSEAMSKALQGIGRVVAGLGLTGLFAGMIKSAGESELALAQLNAVIKSTGGEAGVTAKAAEGLATSLQKTTRFSDEAIISGESMLLTFTQIGKKVFPRATKAVLDYATKFGSVEQAAIAVGKALQDPISGVTNLRRVGVMLSDQQEKQVKDFMAVGNVAAAQNVILTELEKEFGGLAVAAGSTFAGKLDILKNKFDDILEVAGAKLLPKLGDILDAVGKFIDKLGPENTANLVLFAGAIGGIVLALGPLGTALAIIASPIGAIIGAVVGLGLAFQTNFLGIRDIVMGLWKQIEPIFNDIRDIVTGLFNGVDVGSSLRDLGWRIQHGLELMFASIGLDPRIIQGVLDTLNGIATWFTETALPTVLNFITETVIPGIQDFIDVLTRIWTDAQEPLTSLYDWFVSDVFPLIGAAIANFQVNIAEPLIKVLAGLWEAIRPALENVYNWFKVVGLPAIMSIAQDFKDKILAPLVELLTTIWSKVKQPLESIAKFFTDNGPVIGFIVGVVITGAFNILLGVVKEVVKWIGDAITALNDFIKIASRTDFNKPDSVLTFIQSLSNIPILRDFLHLPANLGAPMRDEGGPGVAGQPYMIGRGAQPELFVPSTSGSFFPRIDQLMAQAAPVSSSASYAYNNTYNQQQSMGDIVMNGVQGTSDAMRRYALLRAMGRVR